ncbi:Monooxygenase 2 [Sesamum angolense]|uniref:Monooxygenase 2 n=1 Tax=Sesamum angolense TaxID=2727404 RepID=A0AAE1W5Z3_9LAMI|nr:Monooxygenase 2 [Sesamum angolense]
MEYEIHEDIVIVGAGIAGLSSLYSSRTSQIGNSESGSGIIRRSQRVRIVGFALTMWTNAWRAADALGIGDSLRATSFRLQGIKFCYRNPSLRSQQQAHSADHKFDKSESRCVRRKDLLETLERELPQGTIRYSSRIVSIEESGRLKLLHLADGTVVRTKVLIGCDGANSMVAKWLGLQSPVNDRRSAIRGFVDYMDGHGFELKLHTYISGDVRYGFMPCDHKSIYWFCSFAQSLFKSCDALHPMTPDIGQGGCSSLEDSIILARCLGEALLAKRTCNDKGKDEDYVMIEKGLEKYSRERRWRSFSLISKSICCWPDTRE